ncbi:MAG TPA: cytochrome P450 [Chryseosolibacter sp.]
MQKLPHKTRKVRPIKDAIQLAKHPLNFLRSIIKETDNAPLVPFMVGPMRSFLINDPALIRQLLNSYDVFEKTTINYNEGRQMFKNGIVFSNSDEWRHNRKALNPAFHKQAIEGYISIFSKRGKALASWWRTQGPTAPTNIYSTFVNTTMDITLDVFFAKDFAPEEKEKVARGIDDMLAWTQKRLLRGGLKLPSFIPTPENLAIRKARNGFNEVLTRILNDQSHHSESDDKITMVDLLLKSPSYFGGPMTFDQIAAEVNSIMLAGTETTASVLTWMFVELARQPGLVQRLKAEIHEVIKPGEVITAEKLRKLPLCRQTVNETLRLYPPAWMLMRSNAKEAMLGDYTFKKRTTFYFSAYLQHTNPAIWLSPEKFDPDRFSPERFTPGQKDHFIPFSLGPRKCVGEEFAMLEAMTLMAETIPYFKWSLMTDSLPELDFNATIRPKAKNGKYEVMMLIDQDSSAAVTSSND